MSLSSIIAFMTGFLEGLPEIFSFIGLVAILFLALFYGRIAVAGYRSYLQKPLRLCLKVFLGFLALFSALSLSKLLPSISALPFLQALKLELFLLGMIVSFVLLVSMLLISKNLPNERGLRRAIEKLNSRIASAGRTKDALKKPATLAGLLIIILLLAFSLPGIRYEDLGKRIYSEMGTSPAEIDNLLSLAGSLQGASGQNLENAISLASLANSILPSILPAVQILVYIFFSLGIFGWIAISGMTMPLTRLQNLGLRLGTGFLSLTGGLSFSQYITLSQNPYADAVLEMMQMKLLIAGVATSILIGMAMFLISLNIFSRSAAQNEKERYEKKLKELKPEGTPLLRRPIMIAGLAIVIALLVVIPLGYSGLPDFSSDADKAFLSFGISRQDIISQLKAVQSQAELLDSRLNATALPEECPSLMSVLIANSDKLMSGNLSPYSDQNAKALLERVSGESVNAMFSLAYEGKSVIIGYTDNGKICSVIGNTFCECIDAKDILGGI